MARTYVIDITTMANYFGRMTGITRVEFQLAKRFAERFPDNTRFVYWSNEKHCFEEFRGRLDFRHVQAAKQSRDASIAPGAYFNSATVTLGDVSGGAFVVSGSGWLQNTRYACGAIAFARAKGLQLSFYIHDLIPLKFSYYYEEAYVRRFGESLQAIATSGALLTCNSENTRRDLLEWCEQNGLHEPATTIAYLGDSIAPTPIALDTEFASEDDYVMAVGAVHRRKNYEVLAAAWRRLAARMGGRCPKLKIVGGVTTDGDRLYTEIRTDPVLRSKIEILTGVEDDDLDELYRNATLVAYPSRYEGWGLPVAEALAYGRVCLASNVSSIPEIADLGPDLLEPDDPVSWASRIMFYCQNPERRRAREAELTLIYTPRSWDGTVTAITEALERHESPPPPPLFPGEEVKFNTLRSHVYLSSECYDLEYWGIWMRGAGGRIRFTLPDVPEDGLIARVGLQFLSDTTFDVRLNGELLSKRIAINSTHTYHMRLPATLLQEVNHLDIVSDRLDELPDLKREKGRKRHSGVGFISFGIYEEAHLVYERGGVTSAEPVLAPVTLGRPETLQVVAGKLTATGVTTANKIVALRLGTSMPLLKPFAGTAFLELDDSTKPQLVSVRQNGSLLNTMLLRPDPLGCVSISFDVDSEALDYAVFEFFVMDATNVQGQGFKLTDLYFPEHIFPMPGAMRPITSVATRQYLKFGQDVADSPSEILGAGWDRKQRFGVACHGPAMITATLSGDVPARQVKINGKHFPGKGEIDVSVNGTDYRLTLTEQAENQILSLSSKVFPGDRLSFRIAPVKSPAAFVLRGFEIM